MAARRCVRTYRECQSMLQVKLLPHLGVDCLRTGLWLLHSEGNGKPHCIALRLLADASCNIYDGNKGLTSCLSDIKQHICSALDLSTLVIFKIRVEGDSVAPDALDGLLDLQAGMGEFDCDVRDLLADGDLDAGDEDKTAADEAVVNVNAELVSIMKNEVQGTIARTESMRPKDLGNARCCLCPFKAFGQEKAKRDLLQHLRVHHLPKVDTDAVHIKHYVASGHKQAKMIRSMFDCDRLRNQTRSAYLCDSANMLRGSVRPHLTTSRHVDKQIAMVLDREGPTFMNSSSVSSNSMIRSVGGSLYTVGFAQLVLRESLVLYGRAKPLRTRLLQRFLEAGNDLCHLLPTRVDTWLMLLEDVFSSFMITTLRSSLISECLQHNEFIHLSIDGTLRCAMRTKGQANYRASAAIRASAPITDEHAWRRVITIRGRTGATLGMFLARSESAPDISSCMLQNVDEAVLKQALLGLVDSLFYMFCIQYVLYSHFIL